MLVPGVHATTTNMHDKTSEKEVILFIMFTFLIDGQERRKPIPSLSDFLEQFRERLQ